MNNHNRKDQFHRKNKPQNIEKSLENISPIETIFLSYQKELDSRYDKYERLVKKSRDLTIESKRIIFLLHRITSGENTAELLKDAENRLLNLSTEIINAISAELSKREVFQFIKAFSPGLQEYVEAVSFYHYLKYGKLISIEEVHHPDFMTPDNEDSTGTIATPPEPANTLPMSDMLNPVDFILGIGDLTGELMRKCINTVASGNMEEPFQLCSVLQRIYEVFLASNTIPKDMRRKVFTLKASLQKVENACYAIKIRGSEVPKHMLADLFSADDEYKGSAGDSDM